MRPSPRRWRGALPALAAAGIAAIALAGCGGQGSGGGGGGSTVKIAELEPDHLTPGMQTASFDEMHALFTPLTNFNQNGKLYMDQAQAVTSSDQVHWDIKIKPGWTFSNGEKVTADSYIDAWNATAYGPNGWANNGQLSNIQGYDALNPTGSAKPATSKLSGLQKVSDTEFKVALARPDSQFPYELSGGVTGFYPMPKAAFKDLKAYDVAPIGDGPFEMVGKWQKNVQLQVKRWDGYKGQKAKVDGIVFKIYSDLHTAYTDVQAGNVDITSVGQDYYPRAQKDFPNGFHAYAAPSIDYLGLPLYDPRFKDIRIREAFSLAIDRQAINKALFGGIYEPATAYTPAAEPGSPRDICPYCKFDPAKARQLLAEAGGWNGPLVIWYPSGAGYDQTFQAIGNQLRQNLGIQNVSYQSQPFAQFLQNAQDAKINGPLRGHWGALYPSMQNTLTALFVPDGGTQFTTNYANPEVVSLIQQANGAPSLQQSQALYRQAEERAMQDFPTIPLFFGKYVYVNGKHVSNVIIDVNQIELTQLTMPT